MTTALLLAVVIVLVPFTLWLMSEKSRLHRRLGDAYETIEAICCAQDLNHVRRIARRLGQKHGFIKPDRPIRNYRPGEPGMIVVPMDPDASYDPLEAVGGIPPSASVADRYCQCLIPYDQFNSGFCNRVGCQRPIKRFRAMPNDQLDHPGTPAHESDEQY